MCSWLTIYGSSRRIRYPFKSLNARRPNGGDETGIRKIQNQGPEKASGAPGVAATTCASPAIAKAYASDQPQGESQPPMMRYSPNHVYNGPY